MTQNKYTYKKKYRAETLHKTSRHCCRHLSVDVAVPHVVDCAARAPHHQGAQPEQCQQLQFKLIYDLYERKDFTSMQN